MISLFSIRPSELVAEGLFPPMLTTVQSATAPTIRRSVLVLVAGLRRLLNGWVAAAIACRETRRPVGEAPP